MCDKKSCLDCKFSMLDDLFFELVCSKKGHKLVEHCDDNFEVVPDSACELFEPQFFYHEKDN